MILVVDMCWKENSLSKWEFVEPIVRIVKAAGHDAHVVHHSKLNAANIVKYDKIILCGTALQDNEFLKHDFSWLKHTSKSVFGICAGMEIIAKTFSGSVVGSKEIGMTEIEMDRKKIGVYQLHGKGVTLPDGFIATAENENGVQAIKKGNIYGIQFHPEVRNEKILTDWLNNK